MIINPVIKHRATIDEIFISPLLNGGDTIIAINATMGRNVTLNITGKIYNDKYTNGIVIFSDSLKSSGTYCYYYNNAYTFGNNNEIEITTILGQSETVYRHYINVAHPKYMFLDDEKTMISNYDSYKWDETWSYGKQEYRFINFDEIYMPNFYQKINVNDFKINVSGIGSSYFATSGLFVLNNVDGLFQDLCEEGFKNVAKIPVSFEKESDDQYHVKFDIDLFVDKQTLQMSRYKKEGYIKTKYIYMPRNDMRIQEEIACSFIFDKFGIDNDSFSHSFKFKALTNVMGDCHNSEYCVIRK